MAQYNKLFDKSEIEYITPFLKLWMSFNNWYKQDLDGVKVKILDNNGVIKRNHDWTDKEKDLKTDREAINEYKNQGGIKTEFLRLLNGHSNEDEKFQNALALFVKDVDECDFENFEYPSNLFNRNPSDRVIKSNSLVFISSQFKEFYFTSGDENRLYENTLEMIYQIRCKLVHGNFDIDDKLFINLVEKSYLILYPIMDRILQNQADGEFICKNITKNVDARAIFDKGKITILKGSKVAKDVVDSYNKKEEREKILSEKAQEKDNYFEITQNLDPKSPSWASSFCLGNSSNGWEDWKNKSGKTMNEVLRNN